jgi:hypothetical protein
MRHIFPAVLLTSCAGCWAHAQHCSDLPVCDRRCPADVNGDLALTPADFSAWVGAFNAGSFCADQNFDGAVTPADFSAWIDNYASGCAGSQTPDIVLNLYSACMATNLGAGLTFETFGGLSATYTLQFDHPVDPDPTELVEPLIWGIPSEAGLPLALRTFYVAYVIELTPEVQDWHWRYRIPESLFHPLPSGACPDDPDHISIPRDDPGQHAFTTVNPPALGTPPLMLGYNPYFVPDPHECLLCPSSAPIIQAHRAISAHVIGCDAGVPLDCFNGYVTQPCGFEVWLQDFDFIP